MEKSLSSSSTCPLYRDNFIRTQDSTHSELSPHLRRTDIFFQKVLDKAAVCMRTSSRLLGKLCSKEALWFIKDSRLNFSSAKPKKGLLLK